MEDIQGLMLKSIESHARSEVRIASVELAMTNMRQDNKELLSKMSESLERLAAIQENQKRNEEDHRVIHKRIDEIVHDITAISEEHNPCKSLSNAMQLNSEAHVTLHKRIDKLDAAVDEVAEVCKRCPITGFDDLAKQVSQMGVELQELNGSMKLVNYKVKDFPVWLIFVAIVLVGFYFDVLSHIDLIKGLLGLN